MKRSALAAAFLLFIALCVSVAYWGMQLFKPPARQVTAPPQLAHIDVSPDAAAALFGGRPTLLAQAVNYQLKGVVVSGSGKDSVAILVPEGKPAKAVGINTEISPGVVVKEVHPKYVIVSEGGVSKRIELPVTAPPSSSSGIGPAPVAPLGPPQGAGPPGSQNPVVLGNDTPGMAAPQPQQPEQPPPPPQAGGDQPPPLSQQPSMQAHPGMMGLSMQRH